MSEILRSPVQAVEAAISHFGSAARLAAALEVSGQTVSFWRKGERDGKAVRVPAELCPKVERLTDGKVRCEELQPDVEWRVLRAQVARAATTTARRAPDELALIDRRQERKPIDFPDRRAASPETS